MELDDLKHAVLAARTLYAKAGGADFTLRLPTKLDSQLAFADAHESSAGSRTASSIQFQRNLLLKALVAWAGVTTTMILQGGDAEQVEFSRDAAELLLDENPDVESELFAQLMTKISERKAQQDSAEKN